MKEGSPVHHQEDRGFHILSSAIQEFFETRGKERTGVLTGFQDLDKLLGGLQPSDLIVLGGRPSIGKTSLALNIAVHAALTRQNVVAFFTLELSRRQIAQRLLATESGVDTTRLRINRLSQTEQERIAKARAKLSEAEIFIYDAPDLTVSELQSEAARLQENVGLDLVIVDWLQLLRGRPSETSRSLKELARKLDVPVLAVSQLSRSVDTRLDKIPQLSDLRGLGFLEQDADVVLFIYREDIDDKDSEKKGIAEIHVAKHRNGPVGQVSLLFNERTTKFVDLEVYQE